MTKSYFNVFLLTAIALTSLAASSAQSDVLGDRFLDALEGIQGITATGVANHETRSGKTKAGGKLTLKVTSARLANTPDADVASWEANGSFGVVGGGGNKAIGSLRVDVPIATLQGKAEPGDRQQQQQQQQSVRGWLSDMHDSAWRSVRFLPVDATAQNLRADLGGIVANLDLEGSGSLHRYKAGVLVAGVQKDRVGSGAHALRPAALQLNADIFTGKYRIEAEAAAALLWADKPGYDLKGEMRVTRYLDGSLFYGSAGVSLEKTKFLANSDTTVDTQAVTAMVSAGFGM